MGEENQLELVALTVDLEVLVLSVLNGYHIESSTVWKYKPARFLPGANQTEALQFGPHKWMISLPGTERTN